MELPRMLPQDVVNDSIESSRQFQSANLISTIAETPKNAHVVKNITRNKSRRISPSHSMKEYYRVPVPIKCEHIVVFRAQIRTQRPKKPLETVSFGQKYDFENI